MDNIERANQEKADAFAKQVLDFTNTYSEQRIRMAAKALADDSKVHRGNQNAVMQLFLCFCEEMGTKAEARKYDERNRIAVEFADQIRQTFPAKRLPR